MSPGLGSRIAVTGARGRLGTAVIEALGDVVGSTTLPWRRPDYDLDDPDPSRLLERDRPDLIVHCAAWTDVDGCARDPGLAQRRNTDAVAKLARAAAESGVRLLLVSTNEVFDGERSDGLGYTESDEPRPRNPYGSSKLAGELAAREAFGGWTGLWIVRTAWLYGPPGADFPTKVLAASDRLRPGEPLPMVADEIGSPTFTQDLASAVLALIRATDGGLFHLANAGAVSRFEVAEQVLARCRPGRSLTPISRTSFTRDSDPPPCAVLDCTRAHVVADVTMRAWRHALDDYLGMLCSHSQHPVERRQGG
jgi:dTDP-4-dehydrorhamnose reductase